MTAAVLWYVIPFLVGAAALGYAYGALIWHVNPPVVAVEGTSMLPTLRTGDLVFLKPVRPADLRKGDIIAVRVPTQDRVTYGLPADVVHRIVRIVHSSGSFYFVTKGDNNPGNDVFTTPPSNVIGELHYVVPDVGFAVLFLQSVAGEIFFGAVALIGVLYYVLGLFDDRREREQDAAQAMHSVLEEAHRIEEALTMALATRTGGSPPAAEEPPSAASERDSADLAVASTSAGPARHDASGFGSPAPSEGPASPETAGRDALGGVGPDVVVSSAAEQLAVLAQVATGRDSAQADTGQKKKSKKRKKSKKKR